MEEIEDMISKTLLIKQMKRAWVEMLCVGDHLGDYPDKQTEMYGAAEMLNEWIECLEEEEGYE